MSNLERVETQETILGARVTTPEDEDRWHFSGQMSEMWNYTLSDHWADRLYSEYYMDFWQDIFDDLAKVRHPVEITLSLVYEFGMTTEDAVQKYLADNTDGPRFLVMHREEDDKAQMSCVLIDSFKIKELESV